jgi:hypothetical protein
MKRTKSAHEGSNRSSSVGGSVTGSSIVTGDSNTVTTTYTKTTLPPPESVNIKSEMDGLKQLLRTLNTEDRPMIDNALAEVDHHLSKPNPDKQKVGSALDRAFGYAKDAGDFAEKAAKLAPYVRSVCGWLGGNWSTLLGYVGLTL